MSDLFQTFLTISLTMVSLTVPVIALLIGQMKSPPVKGHPKAEMPFKIILGFLVFFISVGSTVGLISTLIIAGFLSGIVSEVAIYLFLLMQIGIPIAAISAVIFGLKKGE